MFDPCPHGTVVRSNLARPIRYHSHSHNIAIMLQHAAKFQFGNPFSLTFVTPTSQLARLRSLMLQSFQSKSLRRSQLAQYSAHDYVARHENVRSLVEYSTSLQAENWHSKSPLLGISGSIKVTSAAFLNSKSRAPASTMYEKLKI